MKADKDTTLRKLKTTRGQIAGLISRMVEDDRYCIDISNQLMASIAILKNINRDLLHAHLKHCVAEAFQDPECAKQKIDEIISVIDSWSSNQFRSMGAPGLSFRRGVQPAIASLQCPAL